MPEFAEYHQFKFRNNYYVYHVEDGNAFRLSEELAFKLLEIRNPAIIKMHHIGTDVQDALTKLNLKNLYDEKEIILPNNTDTSVTSMSLNVSQDCNMRCVYCYGDDGSYGEPGYMNEKTAFTAIDWLFRMSGSHRDLNIVFFGGEPLLNFLLIQKVVKYSVDKAEQAGKRCHFSISTNGTLFTKKIIQFLNKFRFSITVSFDGNKNIQNRNRPLKNGGNSYRKVSAGIKKLLKSRCENVFGRATITTGFVDVTGIRRSMERMGFRKYDYASVVSDHSNLFSLSDKEYEFFRADLDKQADDLIDQARNSSNITNTRLLDTVLTLRSEKKKRSYCGAGQRLLAISSSGLIYPCHRFVGNEGMRLGDLSYIDSLSRSAYLVRNFNGSIRCQKCWARYLCGGGCLHANYAFSGKFDIPDHRLCKEMKRRIEIAIYVYDQLSNDEIELLKKSKIGLHP